MLYLEQHLLNSNELVELLYVAYNRDSSEKYTLRDALNAEYDRLYSTARDVLEEKKRRIEEQVEENAAKLAARSIIKADQKQREEIKKRTKERAMEMVDEYKDELSPQLYNETRKQVEEANLEENSNQVSKTRRVIRKNV